jgi:sulfur carrier protein
VIVALNGMRRELAPGTSVAQAVALAGGHDAGGVAVAVDGEVVPRSEWDGTKLRDGQAIEIVAAVQGG